MVPGTGLIVAFIVVLWAAYWVPLALRRYDDAAKAGTIDKLSSLSRIIPHRAHHEDGPEVTSAGHEVVAQSSEPVVAAQEPTPAPAAREAVTRPAATLDRPAARLAARRRRRTLLTLVGLTVLVGIVSVIGVVPVWSPVVPLVLVVAWLVACRVQVRGERGLSRPRVATPKVARDKRARSSVEVGEATVVVSHQFEDIDPERKHVMVQAALEAEALDEKITIAVPVGTTQGTALWDPLPVTLPTYVTKPRAGRTVRTIEFGEPGAWTSGHVEGEDVELPHKAASDDTRRAAGQ